MKMSDNLPDLLKDHVEWCENANQRVNRIYNGLCEYERELNAEQIQGEPLHLLDLLESIDELSDLTRSMRPLTAALEDKKRDLQDQINVLERSLDLLNM